jgi:hypothetical protein
MACVALFAPCRWNEAFAGLPAPQARLPSDAICVVARRQVGPRGAAGGAQRRWRAAGSARRDRQRRVGPLGAAGGAWCWAMAQPSRVPGLPDVAVLLALRQGSLPEGRRHVLHVAPSPLLCGDRARPPRFAGETPRLAVLRCPVLSRTRLRGF